MKSRFSLLGIIVLLSAFTAGFSINGDSYSLSQYVGDVEVSHDRGKAWYKAIEEMLLKEADSVKTGIDAYCDINMPGRGNFRVVENSLIYISSLEKQLEAIKVEKGQVLFNISV